MVAIFVYTKMHEDNGFCDTLQYFYVKNSKQVIAPLSW